MSDSVTDLGPTYGALYIGVLFAAFFQGVLSIQTYVYYENFPEDKLKLKLLVAAVWVVDLIHLIFVGQAAYHYLVVNWGNKDSLGFSTWTFDMHLIPLGLATIMCQAFFLWRIYIFSGRSILLIMFLGSMCLATFALDIFMATQDIRLKVVAEFQILVPEVTSVFSIGAASDVLIALLLCFYLRRGGSGFEKTNSIISHLVRYTITTGLATSMLAVACLVAYFLRPNTFIFIAMHFSLGRMYTNSLLATLNSRRSLRSGHGGTDQFTTIRGPTVATGKTISSSFQTMSPISPTSYKSTVPFHLEGYTEKNIRASQVYASPGYVYNGNSDVRSSNSDEIELRAVKDAFQGGFGADEFPV